MLVQSCTDRRHSLQVFGDMVNDQAFSGKLLFGGELCPGRSYRLCPNDLS